MTRQWRRIRRLVLKRAAGHCEGCGLPTREFHVHHLTYQHFGDERLTELLGLCLTCHSLKHPRRKTFRPLAVQRQIAAGRAKAAGRTPKTNAPWSRAEKRARKALARKSET